MANLIQPKTTHEGECAALSDKRRKCNCWVSECRALRAALQEATNLLYQDVINNDARDLRQDPNLRRRVQAWKNGEKLLGKAKYPTLSWEKL